MALDPGERRIGVAVSDPSGLVATPVEVIERAGRRADLRRIAQLAAQWEIDRIIVGHPLTLRGTAGVQAHLAEEFAERVRATVPVEVVLWDERLTTAAAERSLLDAGLRRSRRRQVRDAVAAALLLQGYLDRSVAR